MQVSAFPDHYAKWEKAAAELVQQFVVPENRSAASDGA